MIRQPLSRLELEELAAAVGDVRQLLNRRSPQFRRFQGASEIVEGAADAWLEAMFQEPRLIRRPLWQPATGGPWHIGFDPEEWERALS